MGIIGYNAFPVHSSFVLGKIAIIYYDLLPFINSGRKNTQIALQSRCLNSDLGKHVGGGTYQEHVTCIIYETFPSVLFLNSICC